MRLKCIKLAGFKSFVDPTTVNFPSNLCAVVGPNGCGKSNIIDAVRWVMGESSAKNLRGEAMTDVIFNGSNSRKPIGQASIELVFDNSDGKITGEFASYNEIAVKRKVTRDGQNLYYLNGNKCRRRDITDIFLGTGLGPRSYAIIEQGMISRLIEARPEDLRIYVEEAAGISKYKERRRDTENRMKRTRENLERLTDIRDELERQLGRLERQAQAAEKYRTFKAQERELKARLQAVRCRDLQRQGEVRQQAITALELEVEAAVTAQVHHDSAIEIQRVRHSELGDRFNQVQGEFYSVGADIARLEQTIQHVKERERQLQRDLEQTSRDCTEAQAHLDADVQKAEGWAAELLEIEPEVALLHEAEEASAESLQIAEEAMQRWQHDWDAFNQKSAQPRQQAEVQQSRIQYLEQIQQRLADRLGKLEKENQGFALGDDEAGIELLEEQVAEIDLQLEAEQANSDKLNENVNQLRSTEKQTQARLAQLRDRSQQARGRLASLEALQQAALGRDGAASTWLGQHQLQDAPRLAEQVSVEPGWETALETVMGPYLQAVWVESLDSHMDQLASVEGAEVILVGADRGIATPDSGQGTLMSRIQGAERVPDFLAGVMLAETLEDALSLRNRPGEGQSVVTRDGIWLGRNWVRVSKGTDASAGVFERKAEIAALTGEIQSLSEEIEELVETLEQCRRSQVESEKQRDENRKRSESLIRQQAEARSRLAGLHSRVAQVLEGRKRTSFEIAEVRDQMLQETENLAEARGILEDAIEAMSAHNEEREQLLTRRDELRMQLDSVRQSARQDKDRAHQLALRHQSVKTQLQAVQQGITRLRDQLQRMQERREDLLEQLQENVEPVEIHQAELEEKLMQRLSVEEKLMAARSALEEAESSLRATEKQRQQVEQGLQVLRGRLEKERLEYQGVAVQIEGLKRQLSEEQFDLETLLASLEDQLDEAGLSAELAQIEARIGRLGAINLAAIDEYKTESERKSYLDAQNEDLQEALETLENAIRKIDRETRTRFKETFDQLNSGLQELFPKVFGGGHAYLELTGEDLLDTGIAIMARPPGKRNSTIHLLSGGEKALTAIALVFSIFRLNPAPFCMLDEVDAPLDDANVGRYARMVNEMSEHVQFIYITHNKIAMEMAHQLMGVTMHEPGVSRIVTVDVEEAAELAAV